MFNFKKKIYVNIKIYKSENKLKYATIPTKYDNQSNLKERKGPS